MDACRVACGACAPITKSNHGHGDETEVSGRRTARVKSPRQPPNLARKSARAIDRCRARARTRPARPTICSVLDSAAPCRARPFVSGTGHDHERALADVSPARPYGCPRRGAASRWRTRGGMAAGDEQAPGGGAAADWHVRVGLSPGHARVSSRRERCAMTMIDGGGHGRRRVCSALSAAAA